MSTSMKIGYYPGCSAKGSSLDYELSSNEVCRILGENHLKKIPVTDEGHLVGVVNRSDIAHYTMSKYLEARNQSEETAPAN